MNIEVLAYFNLLFNIYLRCIKGAERDKFDHCTRTMQEKDY